MSEILEEEANCSGGIIQTTWQVLKIQGTNMLVTALTGLREGGPT